MYNPNNYELPEDCDDERLTEYVYSYDVLFSHAVAYKSYEFDRTPWIQIDFGPDTDLAPIHFIMWPETPSLIEAEEVFDVDQLRFQDPGFDEVERRITELMGFSIERAPDLDDWCERAQEIGADRVGIIQERVRYTWQVRAWDGLTLEYAEEAIRLKGFFKEFIEEEDSFIVLDTNEPDDPHQRPAQLVLASEFDEAEFEDPSKPAGWSSMYPTEFSESEGSNSGGGIGRLFSVFRSLFRK